MKIFTFVFVMVGTLLLCGCRTTHTETHVGERQIEITLPILAHMVAEADKSGALVRFVDLRSPEIDRLQELCGPRFQIRPVNESDSSTGTLRLKSSGQEGVHLVVGVTRVRGREAEASGAYVHVGSFASFRYKLRYTGGAWSISSCEFYAAS